MAALLIRPCSSGVEVSLKRYRYTGMERDEETGLNYHGARYYAVWLGRWCSCDPINIAGGVNFYAYTSSNPMKNTDKNGLQSTVLGYDKIDEQVQSWFPIDEVEPIESIPLCESLCVEFEEDFPLLREKDFPGVSNGMKGGEFFDAPIISLENERLLRQKISDP